MPRGRYQRRQWPEEIVDYIKANASADLKINDMQKKVNELFGTHYTREQIKGQYVRRRLPFARGVRHNLLLTDEQAEYLISIIPGRSSRDCAEIMNKKYGLNLTQAQIIGWKKNHKVTSGYDTRWRPGVKPWITGRRFPGRTNAGTWEKGHIAANNLPIGTERVHAGRLYVKVQDGMLNKNWKLKSYVVWEEANGPVPEGMRIVCLDRDPMNCDLSNLALVSCSELLRANNIGLAEDPEINKAIYTVAKLKTASGKRRKKHD